MKKVFIWIGAILLSPILLFIILTILLYIPPIQNWVVDKAAEVASEETGLQIGIDHVSLGFPLDLSIEGVTVAKPITAEQTDTIAHIGRVMANVQFWPLLDNKVVVDELSIHQADINTLDMISDLQVQGTVGLLSTMSRCIDLNEGIAELNGTRLEDANLTILLSDTAAVDTTTSEPLAWMIRADSLKVLRSHIDLHMPGDSMRITAQLGDVSVKKGVVDLLHGLYTVQKLNWEQGALTYDQTFEPLQSKGLDYNHLALNNLHLTLDSIYFSQPPTLPGDSLPAEGMKLGLKISKLALQEHCGLTITQLAGAVIMDSSSIRIPYLLLNTPYSNIRARLETDFSIADEKNPGQLHTDLDASVGKQDLTLFMTDLPDLFKKRWPEWPMEIHGKADGNLKALDISRMEISLPTAFMAKAIGKAANLTDLNQLLAQMTLRVEAGNIGFLTAMLDPQTMQEISIPSNLKLKGDVLIDGPRYTADVTLNDGIGTIKANGWFNQQAMSYDANIDINNLNLNHFLPKQELFELTAQASVKGNGTDFFKRTSWLEAHAKLDSLRYGQLTVDSVSLDATLRDGHALASVTGQNTLLNGQIDVDALLNTQQLQATIGANVSRLDLYAMQLFEKPLAVGMCGHLDVETDLDESHFITGLIGELYIDDSLNTYRPEDVGLTIRTRPDTTYARIQSGNFVMKADASGGYNALINQFIQLADTCVGQLRNGIIDQKAIQRQLPTMRLYVNSGRDNPIANFLRSSSNIDFKDLLVDITTSAEKGVNGNTHIFSLNADSTRIDTIQLTLITKEKGLSFQGVVANNRRNPQFIFRSLIDGVLQEHGATAGVRFYDERGMLGLRLGAQAEMVDEGIRFHLVPKRPTLGYKEFNLNDDNFLLIRHDLKLQGKIDLIADDGTGVKLYTPLDSIDGNNEDILQDLTISLYRFDLEKITSVLPYMMPRISGMLDGDYHLIMNQQKQISVASDMQVRNLIYEQNPIGNLSTEFVYLQREDDTHAVEGYLKLEGREIANIKGEYRNEADGYLDATMAFKRLPMSIANGFVPNQLVGLEGYAEGDMTIKGHLSTPEVNGELYVDSAFLISKPYGIQLRFDNDPVRIINSKLLLENFTMYAYNDNPLNIMGDIDFHNTERIMMNVRMRARDFLLINAKQTKESIAFGKAYVNFFAYMNGRLDQLRMRGRLDVLGTTDLTYLLLDSPLSTDNQLDELVKFTDFSDSMQLSVEKPTPAGFSLDMSINIDQGAHVVCGLNVDQSNYVDIIGGGELRMKYDHHEMSFTGRYTLSGGEMKYSLPIIPLKTFSIHDGSYVEFNGNVMNPRLNLTATERTKATVGREGEQSRSVVFDCGVVITRTLEDMGLEFIIDAPEDMSISSELKAMSTEQRGKLAVTMLTTGMYLADGNTSGFSMNSALSSFLQSEINNITGSALKTLDLSVGLDNTTDATGAMHTDYSFKFAKRFWNNRLKVQIGGKVSSGNEAQEQGQGQKKSFFDNVTMEYRLSPTSNQYVKLFYNQNVYDWLEGYTGEYGGGYIWKRKLSTFWDIFKLWGNNQTPAPGSPLGLRSTNRNILPYDSTRIIQPNDSTLKK